jgi:tyrosyl-tRNA synthetase
MGGADQWGNITAGLELIRRRAEGDADRTGRAWGLSYPLLLAPSGTKFGKTEGGESVWLDASRTTPYAFYQHWLNTDDRDVGTYLRWFTTFTPAEIVALDAAVVAEPGKREAQRALARDITARVHGPEAAAAAIAASEAAFSGAPITDASVLATLHRETAGFSFAADAARGTVLDLLVGAGLIASRGEARRMIQNGGLTVNDERVGDAEAGIPELVAGEWLVVRVGKRKLHVGRRGGG